MKGRVNKEFEFFFKKNYPKVKAFSNKILMSEKDAEDVAQEVFLKLLDKPEIWKNTSIADKYLFAMTRNFIFNFIKHKKIEDTYHNELILSNTLAVDFNLEDKVHAREMEMIILKTVDNMPEQRRIAFRLSRYKGKSNLEIAEIMDLSVRTVERHIYLALADIKKILEIYFPVE